jgi:hypothetical protein
MKLKNVTKTLDRKLGKNVPVRKLRGLSSNFYIHIFSERFIYSHDGSAYLAAQKSGLFVGIYKSLTDI